MVGYYHQGIQNTHFNFWETKYIDVSPQPILSSVPIRHSMNNYSNVQVLLGTGTFLRVGQVGFTVYCEALTRKYRCCCTRCATPQGRMFDREARPMMYPETSRCQTRCPGKPPVARQIYFFPQGYIKPIRFAGPAEN